MSSLNRSSLLQNSLFRVVAGTGVVLCLLAFFHSFRLDDDSFAHFCVSIDAVGNHNWRALITDTWNKPIPGLLYGFTGQFGIEVARLASVLVSIMSAILVYRVAVNRLGGSDIFPPITAIAFYLCQSAVFPQSFLTMTELLAAFFLALGLFLLDKNRPLWAFISFGLMPLARVESVLFVGWLFAGISLVYLTRGRWSLVGVGRVVLWNFLGLIPFVFWWAAGWAVTGSLSWMPSGYVYLREFTPAGILSVNALTALPVVLGIPLLVLFIGGLFSLRTHERRAIATGNLLVSPLLYGVILIQFLFLSFYVVYPRGSGFTDIAVGALNPRNFNTVAPVITLFVFAGAASLVRSLPVAEHGAQSFRWNTVLALAAILIVGFFFFQLQFPFRPSMQMLVLRLFQQLALLAGFVVLLVILVRKVSVENGGIDSARARWMTLVAIYCILCVPLMDPVFWYPLRMNDRKLQAQEDFRAWYSSNAASAHTQVLQDMNGKLDVFCGARRGSMIWVYADMFPDTMKRLAPGSLVLLETDASHTPRNRYPHKLLAELESGRYNERARSSIVNPLAGWEKLFQKLTPRNDPVGWLVYEKNR